MPILRSRPLSFPTRTRRQWPAGWGLTTPGAAFLSWTDAGGQFTGALTVAQLNAATGQVSTTSHNLTGTLSDGRITLSFGLSSNITGTITDQALTLSAVGDAGGIQTSTFRPGTTNDFNQAVANLQTIGQTISASSASAQAAADAAAARSQAAADAAEASSQAAAAAEQSSEQAAASSSAAAQAQQEQLDSAVDDAADTVISDVDTVTSDINEVDSDLSDITGDLQTKDTDVGTLAQDAATNKPT